MDQGSLLTPQSKAVPAPDPGQAAGTKNRPPSRKRHWGPLLSAGLLLLVGAAGGTYWWLHRTPGLPPGFAYSNGRLEANEIDIDTKFAGRIAERLVDEGDMVKKGQVVAVIDTRDLAAQLAAARAQTAQAAQVIAESRASLVSMGSKLKFNEQELQRSRTLVQEGFATVQELDKRQATFDSGMATYHDAEATIEANIAAMKAATQSADYIQVNIADDTLVAPHDGPIEYRLADVGEVLSAGGKVFTMLDVTYVYMDVFFPTKDAGRVKFGDEARIVLEAMPEMPLPATVVFIAAENEFTPKAVETHSEADKLMFRIRVRIDPALLREHEPAVRSGLPGLTYVRLDPNAAWPAALQTKLKP